MRVTPGSRELVEQACQASIFAFTAKDAKSASFVRARLERSRTGKPHHGQALAFVYCDDGPGRRATEKLLTRDETRRIAHVLMKSGLMSASTHRHQSYLRAGPICGARNGLNRSARTHDNQIRFARTGEMLDTASSFIGTIDGSSMNCT